MKPKKPVKSKVSKTLPTAYILEPGQSLREYKALETLWYSKIHASPLPSPSNRGTGPAICKKSAKNKKTPDFNDIEHIDDRGFVSPYTRDYAISLLASEYTQETEEYYRRARAFTEHFDWANADLKGLNWPLMRFIWHHYAEGYTIRDIESVLKGRTKALLGGRLPRKRYVKAGKNRYKGAGAAPSVFWVFDKLKHVLIPAFESWAQSEAGKEILSVDWDLGS